MNVIIKALKFFLDLDRTIRWKIPNKFIPCLYAYLDALVFAHNFKQLFSQFYLLRERQFRMDPFAVFLYGSLLGQFLFKYDPLAFLVGGILGLVKWRRPF